MSALLKFSNKNQESLMNFFYFFQPIYYS